MKERREALMRAAAQEGGCPRIKDLRGDQLLPRVTSDGSVQLTPTAPAKKEPEHMCRHMCSKRGGGYHAG